MIDLKKQNLTYSELKNVIRMTVCVSVCGCVCLCACGIVIERKMRVQLAETPLCRHLLESLGRRGSSLMSVESKRDRKSTFLNINMSSKVFCFQEIWRLIKMPSEWIMMTNMWRKTTTTKVARGGADCQILGTRPCTLGNIFLSLIFFCQALRTLSSRCRKGAQSKNKSEREKKGSDDRTWNLHTCLQLPWRKIRVCTNLKVFNDTKIYYQIKKCRRKIIHHSSSYVFICFLFVFFSSDRL